VYQFIAKPSLVRLGSLIGGWSVRNLAPARWAIAKTIFAQFCGGESVTECQGAIDRLSASGIHTILDYSVEGAHSEADFDATAEEIALTIRQAAKSAHIAFSVFKVSGLGSTEVLEQASKQENFTALDPEAQRVADRVNKLCKLAHDLGVRVFIDAEHTWEQPFIDYLAIEAIKKYNLERPIVFNTYQLYLQDGLERMRTHAQEVWQAGAHFGAKLVRGAYMEKETAIAQSIGKPSPINISKKATDALFDAGAQFCLENISRTAFCLGTHNSDSCQLLASQMQSLGLAPSDARIWFAQLLGMSDNLSYPLAAAGYNVAKYVPYGPIKAVVPYLIRRAQENTTVAGQSGRELTLTINEVQRRKTNVWRFFLP
jgi:proline dehydrogenase